MGWRAGFAEGLAVGLAGWCETFPIVPKLSHVTAWAMKWVETIRSARDAGQRDSRGVAGEISF